MPVPGAPPAIPGQNSFPQWGYDSLDPSKPVVKAVSNQQKISYIGQGYNQWGNSQAWASSGRNNASNVLEVPAKAAGNEADKVANATGLAAIGNFFGDLTSRGTWVRVAKVVIGSVLVITGLAQLTGAGKVIEGVVK